MEAVEYLVRGVVATGFAAGLIVLARLRFRVRPEGRLTDIGLD
jgi:hypothetical protein